MAGISRLSARALALILGTFSVLVALPQSPAAAADTYVGAVVTGRGTTLGSASYTAPAGAIYVSPAGADANPGTLAKPVKTVAKALALVPSGGTVVLRAGTYHESVTVSKKVTIQNYPKEVVWFDGSRVVSGWTKSGTTWVAPFTTFFASDGGATREGYAYAPFPAQVFVDGVALRQVGSAGAVTAGTFFADATNKRLVIGTDPTGKQVRSSDLTRAIAISVPGTNLRGFGVRRYAVTKASRAAVLMDPDGGTFEHLVVSDNARIGLALSGANKIVRNVTVERNGLMGLGMDRANNLVLTNSVFRQNNAERYPSLPVAAGVKITKAAKAKVTNNLFQDTYLAAGLWFDNYSSDVLITNNTLVNNGELGINVEAATRGVIANNEVVGGRKAIVLRISDSFKVMNNRVRGYSLFGVYLAQDDRWTNRPSDAPATHQLLVKNNIVANNIFACGTRFQIFGKDDHTGLPMSSYNSTITGNLFSATSKSPELNLVGWGAPVAGGTEFIQSVSNLAKKGTGWTNLQASTCVTHPETSIATTSQTSAAMAIPSDVASLIGVAAGTKRIGPITASTSTAGVAPTPAPVSAPAPVASGTVLANDAFNRTLTGAWGKADVGSSWSLSGGSSAFSVAGGQGLVALRAADNRVATLPAVSSTTTSTAAVLALGSLPSSGAVSVTLIGRQVGTSTYSARLRVDSTGAARVMLLRNEVQLGVSYALPQKYTPGQGVSIKVNVTGTAPTTIKAKVWLSGTAEPSTWRLSATDSTAALQKSGTVGVKSYLAGTSKAVTVRVPSFKTVKV